MVIKLGIILVKDKLNNTNYTIFTILFYYFLFKIMSLHCCCYTVVVDDVVATLLLRCCRCVYPGATSRACVAVAFVRRLIQGHRLPE